MVHGVLLRCKGRSSFPLKVNGDPFLLTRHRKNTVLSKRNMPSEPSTQKSGQLVTDELSENQRVLSVLPPLLLRRKLWGVIMAGPQTAKRLEIITLLH